MFSDGHQCQADNTEGNYWSKNESLRAVDEEIAGYDCMLSVQ